MTFVLKKNKVKINQLAFNLYVPPYMKLKKKGGQNKSISKK